MLLKMCFLYVALLNVSFDKTFLKPGSVLPRSKEDNIFQNCVVAPNQFRKANDALRESLSFLSSKQKYCSLLHAAGLL